MWDDQAQDNEVNNKTQVEESKEANASQSENTESNEEVKEEANEKVSLSDWEGKWNSMEGYLDKEEVQDAFKTLAEKENTDQETAKKAYLEKRKCDFKGLEIEGEKAKFYQEFPEDSSNESKEVEYKFIDKKEVKHGSHMLEWDIFEAVSPDAEYKYLLMMPIHGEESLTHFHMRYGNDVDELLEKDGWFPTFVKPNTTDSQIIDEITE